MHPTIKLALPAFIAFCVFYLLLIPNNNICTIVVTGESTTISNCVINKDLSELIDNIRLVGNCL
uniref:Movement protein TGBp3 n=1 Tax=papaya mottle-associated virus TaxID=3071214 RepID=A0A6G7S720_9VIRU|nr:Triple gene block protein 3 [papaya mottle-associated virus]QIJ97093.1 Triple gene block protein 3 [papaya mottle-associated virus]QIJ97105.1 Triple gene block protein 3 [papaya mottle-associated virus]